MAGRWYRDRAIEMIDPKVALAASGSTGKVASELAKIPLRMGQERRKDEELKLRREKMQNAIDVANIHKMIAETNAEGKITTASINAAARKYLADKGLKGKELDFTARKLGAQAAMYQADKNVEAKDVAGRWKYKASDVAGRWRYKTKGLRPNKKPTKEIDVVGDDGTRVKYKNVSLDFDPPKPTKSLKPGSVTIEDIDKFLKKKGTKSKASDFDIGD